MKSLIEWIERLRTLTGAGGETALFRLFVPGLSVMNMNGWLLTTEQPTLVPPGFRGIFPETMALLTCLDLAGQGTNANHRHHFSAELAAALAVALERRVDIPSEVPVRIEGQDNTTFLPLAGIADRTVTGPLPTDSPALIQRFLTRVAGLTDDSDISALGAAAAMFHGATQTFVGDIRSAYSLIVAGIEILSRAYGEPPTSWADWPDSAEWDEFFASQDFSEKQVEAMRLKLVNTQALRLKATFRTYASQRLTDDFWTHAWTEWLYGFRMPPLAVDAPQAIYDGHIADFLPNDRTGLSKALALSYDLRSKFVHRGVRFGPLELTLNPNQLVDFSRPLPFAVMRAILRELILIELESKSTKVELPDVKLQRNWSPDDSTRPVM